MIAEGGALARRALRGSFRSDPATREEFLRLVHR